VTQLDPLPIAQCGDPVLRGRSAPVDPVEFGSELLLQLVEQMRVTMDAAPGVGLAAPQVGVAIQVAVLYDGPDRWYRLSENEMDERERTELPFTVLVNPTVEPIEEAGSATFFEGCLSVAGLTGVVERHRSVRVHAFDEHGRPINRVFTGWPARIVQHEVDHLNGKLYLDRVKTRSLSTTENYSKLWAGKPTAEAAETLGF
jgi:peptide deformylase